MGKLRQPLCVRVGFTWCRMQGQNGRNSRSKHQSAGFTNMA